MSSITQPASFNVSKLSLSAVKASAAIAGFKSAYLNYGDGTSLTFQTPSLPSPFGLSVFDKSTPPKYTVDVALRGYEENPKVKAFYTALESLDNYMIDQGVKNSKAWFGKEKSREVIEDCYTSLLKWSKDKNTGERKPYPPSLKIKLTKKYGSDDFECKFYTAKSEPITETPIEDILVKRSEMTSIIQCTGVYIANGKFGLGFKAVQIRMDKVPSSGIGNSYAFGDDGGDESHEQTGPAFSEPQEFAAKPSRKPVVEDSESEEEEAPAPPPKAAPVPAPAHAAESEEASEDEEVAPAPVPKKPVITKKKVVAAAAKK
jgi:hypothetical protein